MVETIRYTRIFAEDLDLGLNTKQVRLSDQATYTMHQIHLTKFLTVDTLVVPAANFIGQPTMVWTGGLPPNRRIWGVTVKNLTALGASGGLTGYRVGDPTTPERWSNADVPLALNAETDEGDFSDLTLMIYQAATDIILSGVGGLFDAAGRVEIAVQSSVLRHPS